MKEKNESLKKKYESLAESLQERARSDALFWSIGEGAVTTDADGKVVRINTVALRALGINESDAVGHLYCNVLCAVDENGKDIPLEDRPLTIALSTGAIVSKKFFFRTSTGAKIPVALNVSPIKLNDKLIGAIAIFRDISHDHEVDRMKSEFISIASHQLRTPLSAIQTYSNMLAEGYQGDFNAGQQEFMQIILSSIDRMNELIDTLLDVTRLESGKLVITNRLVNLSQILDEVIQGLTHVIDEKEIDINIIKHSESVKAITDQFLVKEAYSNLLSNAIKYTPEHGNIKVDLGVKNDQALLIVTDSGYGIPFHVQDRIYTKFFRSPNILATETSGSGLGLYMVKSIADTLHGTTWFVSHENQGSKFYFGIPV